MRSPAPSRLLWIPAPACETSATYDGRQSFAANVFVLLHVKNGNSEGTHYLRYGRLLSHKVKMAEGPVDNDSQPSG